MTTAHSGSVSIYKGETSTLERFSFVPGAGLEPARPVRANGF
jgi:hypothetical protein